MPEQTPSSKPHVIEKRRWNAEREMYESVYYAVGPRRIGLDGALRDLERLTASQDSKEKPDAR